MDDDDDAAVLAQHERPKTRGGCLPVEGAPPGSNHARPCVWAGCRYSLMVHYVPPGSNAHGAWDGGVRQGNRTASPRLQIITEDPCSLADTCALDVADRAAGGALVSHLDLVPYFGGGTRQGVHVLENAALKKAARANRKDLEGFKELLGEYRRAQDDKIDGDPTFHSHDNGVLGLSAYSGAANKPSGKPWDASKVDKQFLERRRRRKQKKTSKKP